MAVSAVQSGIRDEIGFISEMNNAINFIPPQQCLRDGGSQAGDVNGRRERRRRRRRPP